MNASLELPVVAEPRWRAEGFLQSLGPAYWSALPAQPLAAVHWVARSDALAEPAIRRAREGDFSEVQRLLKVLQRPFDEQPEHEADAGLPPDWAQQIEVSCSS